MARKKAKRHGEKLSKEEIKRRRALRDERRQAKTRSQPDDESALDEPQQQSSERIAWPSAQESALSWEDYRFLNPYNFVRSLPAARVSVDNPDSALLGRCKPPPHDRYLGISGRIVCNFETVTPLFISDSHDVRSQSFRDENGVKREHRSYRFFQSDQNDMIPATSLRGMVRSVFEAITNSCFGVFNADQRLDYRDVGIAQKMQAAIVTRLPTEEEPLGEVALCADAKLPAYTNDKKLDPAAWRCGEEAFAVVSDSNTKVTEPIVRDPAELHARGLIPQKGWVKITGQTIPGKRFERFCFYPSGESGAERCTFDAERMHDYNDILEKQISDETRGFRTFYQHRQLTVGDLVYVRLSDDGKSVQDISLVRVPRLKYRKAIGELLPSHLHPCREYEILCPACRTFGWVKGAHRAANAGIEPEHRIAYAGRVSFSHGRLIHDAGVYDDEIPLAILSTPKPTTGLFYLLKTNASDANGEPPEGELDVAYKDGYRLRDRKFYRHHGSQLNRQAYERAGQKRDHQNRSVRGVRAPGNVFEFEIRFENLARVELGALLWALTLDEDGHHRLGYGKPLGFGSVKITIQRLDAFDWGKRYKEPSLDGGMRCINKQERSRWIADFDSAMKAAFGQTIHEATPWFDLRALLNESIDLPVHYPRTEVNPDVAGMNFVWFEENSRSSTKREEAGPHHALALAPDDREGLPLLKPKDSES